jgi:heptosyltransferase-2
VAVEPAIARPPCDDPWPRPSWPARRGWRAARRALFGIASALLSPRKARRPIEWASLRRVVVVRDDRLGDALLATPLLRALRAACPRAEIVVVASPANREVFERLEGAVDRVAVSTGRWRELRALARGLRALGPIDLVLDLYSWTELRPALLAWWSRAPRRAGFDLDHRAFLHTDRFGAPSGLRYEVERNLDLVRDLGLVVAEGGRPRFAITGSDRAAAQEVRRVGAGGDGPLAASAPREFVVLHPGSGNRYQRFRRVAPAVLGEVARRLATEWGLDVLVTGGPDEHALAEELVAAAAVPAVRSVAGQLSLGALAALLEAARFVVVPDTGVLHLAVAVGAEVVALVGPVGVVNGPARVLPQGTGVHAARRELGCRPEACFIERCRSVACLRDLDAETISAACARALAATSSGSNRGRP